MCDFEDDSSFGYEYFDDDSDFFGYECFEDDSCFGYKYFEDDSDFFGYEYF